VPPLGRTGYLILRADIDPLPREEARCREVPGFVGFSPLEPASEHGRSQWNNPSANLYCEGRRSAMIFVSC
jgi:hypothetical protein